MAARQHYAPPSTRYYSGFEDLISSGSTGLQSQLDWSQSMYPYLWSSEGNYLGERRYGDFLSQLQGTPLFGGVDDFQPLIFQGGLFQPGMQTVGRYPGTGGSPHEYHPFGMIHLGAAPEQATLGQVNVTTDPNFIRNVNAQRYMDPSTGNMFNVVRQGELGYAYGMTPSESSLVTDDTVTGGVGEDTVTGGVGDDTVAGGVGDDTVTGGVGEDTVTGGVGDDTVTGGVGEDTVTGGVGEDTVTGGVGEDTVAGETGLTTTTPQTWEDLFSGLGQQGYQNLLGGWGLGQQGYGYTPGFNLPEAQYPVPGDRPTFSDYTNQQIIQSLRAENNWSIPDATEGTYREREGWDAKSDQDILDYMAGQPASWLQDQQEDYRPAALALMGQDIGQRNEFQQRTQAADILNMANAGFLGSMQMMQGYGQGAMQEVGKNYMRNIGSGRAGLASRGMTGTTVYDAMVRGAGEQSMQDWLTAKDAVTGRQIQVYQQGIGGIVNALNSIQYRTMHPMEYANLYQAFGEGGAGADVPEAPSTTTNALLGAALGIATPLLLGSIFGPVGAGIGAGIGGLFGSAASTGSNVLGGVGDLLGDAWDFFEDLWPF